MPAWRWGRVRVRSRMYEPYIFAVHKQAEVEVVVLVDQLPVPPQTEQRPVVQEVPRLRRHGLQHDRTRLRQVRAFGTEEAHRLRPVGVARVGLVARRRGGGGGGKAADAGVATEREDAEAAEQHRGTIQLSEPYKTLRKRGERKGE